MQSIFQYRRLRREVQQDLARAHQAKLRPNSPTTRSTTTSTPDPEIETEKAHDDKDRGLGVVLTEKPALSTDVPLTLVPGVTVSRPDEADGSVTFIVGWKENDPNNPLNFTMTRKWTVMVACSILAVALTIPSSVEGPTQDAFNAHFGVNPMAGSMVTGRSRFLPSADGRTIQIPKKMNEHSNLTAPTTHSGIFLLGIGVGSLIAGPFSETLGRNASYFGAGTLVTLFEMAKALAPNYGGALAFRFLCAVFAATPMTVTGGTVGDIFTPMQITFGLPMATICAYAGPILGPVIGAYTPKIGFEWADWISMIITGAALVFVLLIQPETYSPLLLQWRAKHLRDLTGDNRYQAEHASASSLGSRLLNNLPRPFTMVWTEPIIMVFSFYLVLLYFVLFTFLNGYPFIFGKVYGISNGLTFVIWVAMIPGVVVATALVPYMYHLTKKAAKKAEAVGQPLQPEVSLYWTMAGASVLMPISLFWMAWTCYVSVPTLRPRSSNLKYFSTEKKKN